MFTAVDVESVVTNVLPSNLDRLAPTLTAGAQSFVDIGLTRVLGNPEVQQLLTDAVERAHSALMRLLSGDGLIDGITVEDGAVTVNLLPLVSRALTFVQGLGLLDQLDVPELTRAGDPTEQIAELETAIGRDLPDDFGQLTVFQSDKLADAQASVQNAQRAMALLKRATWLLADLAVVFLVATVLLAHNRWRAGLWLALGVRRGDGPVADGRPPRRRRGARPGDRSGRSGGDRRHPRRGDERSAAPDRTDRHSRRPRGRVDAVPARLDRHDLLLVGAVVLGLAVVAVLGFSIGSLLLGVALAVAVVLLVPRVLRVKASGGRRPPDADELDELARRVRPSARRRARSVHRARRSRRRYR